MNVQLRNIMANFSPDSGASLDHCQGIIVGAVGGLMATGKEFHNALEEVVVAMPHDGRINAESVPPGWLKDVVRIQTRCQKLKCPRCGKLVSHRDGWLERHQAGLMRIECQGSNENVREREAVNA